MIEAKIFFIILLFVLVASLFRLKYTNQIRLLEKVVFLFFFVSAILLILNPFLLDRISSPLKIERGRDLLFYLYILLSTWGLIRTHIRLNLISSRINKLVGEMAINFPERIDN